MNTKTGIYIRISVMDDKRNFQYESESVENQRLILMDYLKDNNLEFIKEYVDDGYSGTNFKRPAFIEMIEDLKKGLIDTVVVKDLSRFGRDHIMTGYYLETFFPINNYRFISALENIDSQKQQNDYNESVTFVMACNDYYSKQNSIKIRTILESKRRAGKFVGSRPPFGYMRDPEDKGHLIPDPNTAHIVTEMFGLLYQGKKYSEIADIFNMKGYPTPSLYRKFKDITEEWIPSNIRSLKQNEIYTGDMVQGKETNASYKSDKKIKIEKSKWAIVPDTHEALVDKEIFNYVQDPHKSKEKTLNGRDKKLFENLIYCKECGCSISLSSSRGSEYLQCNSKRRISSNCSSHYMKYDIFERQILKCLIDNNIISDMNIKRKGIQDKLYSILVDKNRKINIYLKNSNKIIYTQYKCRKIRLASI